MGKMELPDGFVFCWTEENMSIHCPKFNRSGG